MLSLNSEQRQAVGLLSIGTFLEYFELMLYVHMAVLLNDLFFPKTDPFTASLISAGAFCSSYVLRPVGALLFGYIGDKIGRRVTVVITTFLMAFSCFTMTIVPTYTQIGITAAWIVTACRIVQGMSSMGEIVGAQLYLTEVLKPPIRYPSVILISVTSVLGTTIALITASLVTLHEVNWRYAFGFGVVIAVIGSVARTSLRETPDFIDAKRRISKVVEKSDIDVKLLKENVIWQERLELKTALALFLIQSAWPLCSYFTYVYCGNILKNSFGFTAADVIHQNLVIAIFHLLLLLVLAGLSYRIYPLKIAKIILALFFALIITFPYLLEQVTTPSNLFMVRLLIVLLAPASFLIIPIAFLHIPVFKRFTYVSLSFAISHALVYVITSFSIVYLIEYFNYWGVTIIALPISLGFAWALLHFEKLEKAAGNPPRT